MPRTSPGPCPRSLLPPLRAGPVLSARTHTDTHTHTHTHTHGWPCVLCTHTWSANVMLVSWEEGGMEAGNTQRCYYCFRQQLQRVPDDKGEGQTEFNPGICQELVSRYKRNVLRVLRSISSLYEMWSLLTHNQNVCKLKVNFKISRMWGKCIPWQVD